MSQLKQRVEFLTNGITITNQFTGDKEASYNASKVGDNVKGFVQSEIGNAEPGEYYDVHVTITKQRNKKPS